MLRESLFDFTSLYKDPKHEQGLNGVFFEYTDDYGVNPGIYVPCRDNVEQLLSVADGLILSFSLFQG